MAVYEDARAKYTFSVLPFFNGFVVKFLGPTIGLPSSSLLAKKHLTKNITLTFFRDKHISLSNSKTDWL